MEELGYPRTVPAISKFERGGVEAPTAAFIDAYARALGVRRSAVIEALQRTARWRIRRVEKSRSKPLTSGATAA